MTSLGPCAYAAIFFTSDMMRSIFRKTDIAPLHLQFPGALHGGAPVAKL